MAQSTGSRSGTTQAPQSPRRAELIAALSLAIDLGLGQPMEHMLRSCVLGMRLAERIGLDDSQRDEVFYCTLLTWIGCHADSHELAALFGDDIEFRADTYAIDKRGLPLVRFMVRHAATGDAWTTRAAQSLAFLATGRQALNRVIRSHCISAATLARLVGIGDAVADDLGFAFERWDGAGLPRGACGDEIPLPMRIVHVSDTIEVHLRQYGAGAARMVAYERRGTQFDPEVSDCFIAGAEELVDGLLDIDVWSETLAYAPYERPLEPRILSEVLTAMGDFADLKSPFTVGHSRSVAALADAAAGNAGLDEGRRRDLRHAGLLHDLGRLGVSNSVWDKPSALSTAEYERVRLHPYLTERILRRVPALHAIAGLAGAHHERLDGSGYARGVSAESLDISDRLLAAADRYQTAVEPRPHRAALSPEHAAQRLHDDVRAARLDAGAVQAVLSAAGHSRHRRGTWPAGLTIREVDVLRLLIRGFSNREIAAELTITSKTARNHLEHIYAKVGVNNRTSASLFALRNGIVGHVDEGV